jgi:hypothetical protein
VDVITTKQNKLPSFIDTFHSKLSGTGCEKSCKNLTISFQLTGTAMQRII